MANDPTNRDDLARTATAPVSAVHPEPADALGASLGRYRLERELGAGGMGVVHAAFDPDLERRIALKVLRVAMPGLEAKDRLLREARAMARLAHPNVVTVHEVGTANGRDYVAMELIQGETLADWLRSGKRRPFEIIAAFLAAGRGLAAAHAAGIVHRDFKPHNVLRSRHGRIVVTDFGLAREAQVELPMRRDAAISGITPLLAPPSALSSSTPGSLPGITATGALLGTPAYMAPEQWSGGMVTPATDQFAFCVALWEALAGERPYRGTTLDELRSQAALGPAALDASRIPRRLRAILRRGLDPDPAERWPSMDVLLHQIVRVERRPGIALGIGIGAVVAVGVLVLALRAGDHLVAAPRCQPPAFDPVQVWSPAVRAGVGTQAVAVRQIDAELAAWRRARGTACKVEPVARAPQLSCLDGVLARIDAVIRAITADREGPQVDAGALLIDPDVCKLPRAPRLMPSTSPELRDVMAAWLIRTASPVPLARTAAGALVARAVADPCASSLAHVLAADVQRSVPERSRHLDEAQQDAERCGDDRVLAETAISAAQHMLDNEWLSAAVTAKLRLADAAAHRVEQRDLIAQIDLMRVEIAKRAENLEEAIARVGAAIDGFAARGRLRPQLDAGLSLLALRQLRASPADLAAIPEQLAAWRTRAVAELGPDDEIVRSIDTRSAAWAFAHGDVAGAHAALDKLWRPLPNDRPLRVAGVVVDALGRPVAGATVTVGRSLRGDSSGAAGGFVERDSARTARTDGDGQFEIPDAVDDAVVVAELGDRRSAPTGPGDNLRLALAPTSRLEGRVELAGEEPINVVIIARALDWPVVPRYAIRAPVAADGSFTVDGLPRGQVLVFAAIDGLNDKATTAATVAVRGPVVRGIALSVARSSRVVHILVRNTVNTRLSNAEVVVLPGRVPSTNLLEMNRQFRGGSVRLARQLESEHAPREIVAAAQPGDLFATMNEVPEGPASACALGLNDLSDEELEHKLYAHLDRIQVICAPIPEDASFLMIQVPPFPRLD
ncbi:MAG TPA: protein kinase [Kofleriaceae bacterium]|nr:protein kinase [Kofleriaceae bacterium]